MDSFWAKYVMLELMKYRDLCGMTLKDDAILKEKWTGGLKNDIRNLVNFHASTHKSENFHFDGLVLPKAYKVLNKNIQKSCVP